MSELGLIIFWVTLILIAYIHLIYPLMLSLVVFLASRRRIAPVRTGDSELPTTSLIIPACNEAEILAAKLENSLRIDYPDGKLEILVASDGSQDATVAIAKSFADRGIKLLDFDNRRGKASVMNDAAEVATGEVLCFCDANVMIESDAVRRLVAHFQDERIGAASGDVRLRSSESNFGSGESLFYRMERLVQRGETQLSSMIGVDGGLYVIRKSLFKAIPEDTILDDFCVSIHVLQEGSRVVYEPAAVAFENGTPMARHEFRRRSRVSAGAVQSVRRLQFPPLKHPIEFWQYCSHKLLRWTCPLLLVVMFVANLLVLDQGLFYIICLGLQIAFYAFALLASVALPLRKTPILGVIFYFVLSHTAMAFGFVKGVLNLQPVTWRRTERTNAAGTSSGNSAVGSGSNLSESS